MKEISSTQGDSVTEQAALDRRLNDIGWRLLLILTGGVALAPSDRVPEGAWLLGAATILIGVNVVRYARHIHMSGLSQAPGLFALAAGLGGTLGVDLPLLAICLVVIGLSLVVKPWFSAHVH